MFTLEERLEMIRGAVATCRASSCVCGGLLRTSPREAGGRGLVKGPAAAPT